MGHDPERVRKAAEAADAIFLAGPFAAVDDAVQELEGMVNGKVLVDVTNAIDDQSRLALGFTTSGAEELQKKAPSDPIDAGPLQNARLEPMAYQNIQLGYALGMGTDIGFRLVH